MAGNDSLEAASTTPKLSEETRRKFDEASEDTLQLICGLKGSLERQALVGALTKVLSKKSEHRHPAEIDLLVQNTRHVKIFERLSIHRHRDVCRLMQLLKTTDGQPLGVNGYITSFYLVLTGTAQRLNEQQQHGGSDALNFGLAAGNKTNIVKRHHITTGRETHLTKEFMSKDPQRMTEELKHWFDLMDADSSGSVSMKELRQSLRSMRINIPIHELNRWFSAMDEDGSGQIDFEEFHR
eukprot:gene18409-21959_t